MTDEDDGGQGFSGFMASIPAEVFAQARADHDRHHMLATDNRNRVDAFLEGLDVEGLMALRIVLDITRDKDPGSAFMKGQVRALLKWVHGVDPGTGQPLEVRAVFPQRPKAPGGEDTP